MRVATGETATAAAPSERAGDTLNGTPLLMARVGWVALATLVVALNIAGIPASYGHLQTLCQPGAACSSANLTPAEARLLPAEGLTLPTYAAIQVGWVAFGALILFLVGLLIFLRRSSSRMALLASIVLVLFGGSIGRTAGEGLLGAFTASGGLLGFLAISVKFLGGVGFPVLFFLFPSGHWAPRWVRWLVIPIILDELALFVVPIDVQAHYAVALNLIFVATVPTTIFAQVYRYLYVSTPSERQQTKWVVYAFALGVSAFAAITVLTSLVFPQASATPLGNILINVAIGSTISMVPVSIGIAIMRSRLFDIDVIITRTLLYGALTAVLATIYFGVVVALQGSIRLFNGSSGEQPWTVVLSTLVIAALFQPLRRFIQAGIDRRFYRSRYDAARTLTRFSATLRHEVDLSQVTTHLLTAVDDTLRPAHVSLWLRAEQRSRPNV